MKLPTLVTAMALCTVIAPAQRQLNLENPLAGKPEALEAGRKLFASACSSCHGVNGEGGRGPNLVDGVQVRRQGNPQLFDAIHNGVPGTDMPAFPLPDEKIWQLVTFVRNLGAPAFETIVPGDVEAGAKLFYGAAGCTNCHMIGGHGGSIGPDLSNAGARAPLRQLQEAVLHPSARIAEGFEAVDVTLKSGQSVSGIAKNRTNYSLQLLDMKGDLHLLDMSDVREIAFHRNSLMPADYAAKLSKDDLQNLFAFLSRQSIRTERARQTRRAR